MKQQLGELMDSKAFQDYAALLVLGTQLYAWAHHYILKELPGDIKLKLAVIGTVNNSMMDAKGNPHPFDEVGMYKNLEDRLSYIKNATKRHVRELEAIQNKATPDQKPDEKGIDDPAPVHQEQPDGVGQPDTATSEPAKLPAE